MAMPETAMNQYDGIIFGQNDIRPAGQFAPMEPVPETKLVQAMPDQDFRSGILGPDPAHHA